MTDVSIALLVLGVPLLSFVALIVAGYLNNQKLDKGEMRRAIAAFFVLLFGSLVAASFIFPDEITLTAELKGLFAGTFTTIIGFYFGSRSPAPPPS